VLSIVYGLNRYGLNRYGLNRRPGVVGPWR